MRNTDKAWQEWGAVDPYYAVLTSEEYRGPRLSEDARRRFFETGRDHYAHLLATIRKRLSPGFSPKRALDFGCGTGRVLIPMAEMCEEVLGLDISEPMLSECRANCRAANLGNVTLKKPDRSMFYLSGHYDLIHSFLVFQHIRPSRGERIIPALLNHLAHDGVAVLHVVYRCEASVRQRMAYFLRHHVPGAHRAIEWLRHRYVPSPRMEMNVYDMNRFLGLMHEGGVRSCHIELVRHGAYRAAAFYVAKGIGGGTKA